MDLSSLLWCLTLFYSPGYIRYSLNTIKRSRYGLQHDLLVLICLLHRSMLFFLYPATKVWRGIMLYPSVSVRPSIRPSVRLSVRPSVCPSVRPCSPFPIDNLSIYSRNFFKFCIHIVIGGEWYGIVNGQNPSVFNGVTALFRIGKMVSGLLFLYCS